MPIAFSVMRGFEDQRVMMVFDDGLEVIARLLSTTEDMDGEQHLIYDHVEWANDPRELATAKDSTVYAEAESLVAIEKCGLMES
jgi:hypothetical protein